MTDADIILKDAYENALNETAQVGEAESNLSQESIQSLDTIVSESECNKGVYTVVMTSVVYKLLYPEQDIRKHQSSIPGGYSGRTFDTKHITSFLKECGFPAMAESGWLTRSLEQKVAYNKDYPGAIKEPLKHCFLSILDDIETGKASPSNVLDYMLRSLIRQREKKNISLALPQNLSINEIINLLGKHFHHCYKSHGAARLPVLALYAAYQCLMTECKRFDGKNLLPLESHTSADSQSGRMGDIDVNNQDNTPFEAVEVKFDIPISYEIAQTAKSKIEKSKVSRYYILSTKGTVDADAENIDKIIRQLKNIHGCQLVVNGVFPSLKYYLRIIEDTSVFIENYVMLLSKDKAVLFEHKEAWNDLVSSL